VYAARATVSATRFAELIHPKWLGAQPAFTLVLHTWTRELLFHPHLHAIVAAGGLSPDASRWIDPPNADFLFPVTALARVFRGRFLEGFIDLCQAGAIDLSERQSRALVRKAKRHDWVVFAKKPFGGPAQIVRYLGRYTHRVAISSSRLVSISDERIVFRTRGEKTCALAPEEFIRRFLLHVLPHQLFKIRHYGLLAPANVGTRLVRAQELLGQAAARAELAARAQGVAVQSAAAPPESRSAALSATDRSDDQASLDRAAPVCPYCGGPLVRLMARRSRRAHGPPPDT
jgi:hypothetical protein